MEITHDFTIFVRRIRGFIDGCQVSINKSTSFLSHRNASYIRYSQESNIYAILAPLSRVYLTNNSFHTFVCPLLLNICIVRNNTPSACINVGEKAQGNRVDPERGREKACNFPWRRRNDTLFPPFLRRRISLSLSLSPPLTQVKPSSYTRKLLGDALADSYLCGWKEARFSTPFGSLLLLLLLRLCLGYNRVVDSTADDSSSICGRPIRRVLQRDCGKENLIVLSGIARR